MTMGNLVAVEFSGVGNALYGYDVREDLPFDTATPLRLGVDVRNSLKHKERSILWLSHQDGIHNFDKWEHMFEARLRRKFGIEPGNSSPTSAPTRHRIAPPPPPQPQPQPQPERSSDDDAWQQAADVSQPYSRSALNKFANARGLQVEDKTTHGGSLWVWTDADFPHVVRVLTRWGFRHRPGKGWWK